MNINLTSHPPAVPLQPNRGLKPTLLEPLDHRVFKKVYYIYYIYSLLTIMIVSSNANTSSCATCGTNQMSAQEGVNVGFRRREDSSQHLV